MQMRETYFAQKSVASAVAEQDQRNDDDPDATVVVEKIAKAVHRMVLPSE